jgi:hypothetical protein
MSASKQIPIPPLEYCRLVFGVAWKELTATFLWPIRLGPSTTGLSS